MNGKLSIETTETRAEVTVEGRAQDIMFNWIALTHCIGRKLNIPPLVLAATLPSLLQNYEKTLASSVEVDLAALRKEREGGGKP